MRRVQILAVMMTMTIGLAALAAAGDAGKDLTVTGTIVCAKCTLAKPDAKDCQNVLVAEDKTEYYLVKNEVAEKFGHLCKGAKPAVVTGTVSDRDGRAWIEATKIEEPKAEQGKKG
jgi:hypothetical protein